MLRNHVLKGFAGDEQGTRTSVLDFEVAVFIDLFTGDVIHNPVQRWLLLGVQPTHNVLVGIQQPLKLTWLDHNV